MFSSFVHIAGGGSYCDCNTWVDTKEKKIRESNIYWEFGICVPLYGKFLHITFQHLQHRYEIQPKWTLQERNWELRDSK